MQHTRYFCGKLIRHLSRRHVIFKPPLFQPNVRPLAISHYYKAEINQVAISNQRNYHEEYDFDSEDNVDIYQDQPQTVKHILYANQDDPLLPIINASASSQDVFDFLNKYNKILEPKHLAQVVLVLWDLQMMFQHVTEMSSIDKVERLMQEYKNELITKPEFNMFLDLIIQNIKSFDVDALACMYIYLYKSGLNMNHDTMKAIFKQLNQYIEENHEHIDGLPTLSRYLVSAHLNENAECTETLHKVLPIVYKKIEKCDNSDDLKLLSICLNVQHQLIPKEIVQKYVLKVDDMLEKQLLTAEDTTTMMKVILMLNYPMWRHEHTELRSKCIMLLKPKLGLLSLQDVNELNNVFLKNQEPAEILVELQRVSAKHLRELEENQNPLYLNRLRLATALIHMSSPAQRPESEEIIRKYARYPLNGRCLLELLKCVQFARVMDPLLCKSLWEGILIELEHDEKFKNEYLLKTCFSYLTYNQNLPYRQFKIEKRLNQWIEGLIETAAMPLNGQTLTAITAFVLPYGNDVSIINYVTNNLSERWQDVSMVDCLTISKSLHVGRDVTRNVHLKDRYRDSLCATLDKVFEKKIQNVEHNVDINESNMMIKSYLYRGEFDHPNVEQILATYKSETFLSSRHIKNLTMCCLLTSAFLPQMIDRMVAYVCRYKQNVMAFNAEKVAYLCYYLGYIPRECEKFSKVLVDLIIRDQEKISGLTYLQGCLALCFFNSMTRPLIKQIFNVRFMEKLDLELQNCYAKDVYPNRVRNRLMELNRTVCIDYPELTIPWFHQKFVNRYRNAEPTDSGFHQNVLTYLNKLFFDCDIESNAFTPYGYNIDFTLSYKEADNNIVKLALLLLKSKSYTLVNVQLKGAEQIKIRHLEMLGYNVKVLPFNEWNSLVYGEDKIAYLMNLLEIPNRNPSFYFEINR